MSYCTWFYYNIHLQAHVKLYMVLLQYTPVSTCHIVHASITIYTCKHMSYCTWFYYNIHLQAHVKLYMVLLQYTPVSKCHTVYVSMTIYNCIAHVFLLMYFTPSKCCTIQQFRIALG